MKLSIIIPVFNEAATVEKVLETIVALELYQGLEKEIILVNDDSSDASSEIIKNFISSEKNTEIKLIEHTQNQGKGAAIQTGIKTATGDFCIIQDADLEYDPNEYDLLLKPLLDDKADIVYGSRFIGGAARRSMGFWHFCANKFLTFLTNLLCDIYLTDMETCYKAFRTDLIKALELKEKRFGIEPEITIKLAKQKKLRIIEVPISYYGRDFSEGKKIHWSDGFKAIFYIFKYSFFA